MPAPSRSPDRAARAARGVVVRTPLLPLEVLSEWAAAADPRDYLAELVARPDVREALFVASPSLVEGLERWRRDPDSPAGGQVELALGRYVARMAARATPFGLCSGVSMAQLARESSLELAPRVAYRRRTRIVDLVKPAHATLATHVAAEVARAIAWLRTIVPPPRETALDQMRAAFVERYEEREAPLVEVLDEESGIGFEATEAEAASPLLAGLRFETPPRDEQPRWTAVERHLHARLAEALATGAREIVLDEADRRALASGEPPPIPQAFSVLARLGRESTLLVGAAGPSGARLLGRFCHASPEIEAIVRDHLRAEEAHRPEAIFAEIVHLDEGRIGNITCRPVLRDYEIVCMGISGAPAERQLPIDDLMVSVRGGLYPPVDKAGHRFEPMGQITAAFGAATAAALAALVAMYRPLRTNPREESVGLAIIWLIAIAGQIAHLAGLW